MNDGVNERKFNELIIIDSNIADVGTILGSLAENQYALLLSDGTGMDELLSFLTRSENTWSAMHFITHGSDASFSLNGETISSANLNLAKWAELGSYLAEGGDILLYGCNVASTDAGKSFIIQLATAIGADVAASDDITGLGGDWNLESSTGAIEAKNITPSAYDSVLYEGRLEIKEGESKKISNDFFTGNIESNGGALYNSGIFTAKGSTFSWNNAWDCGGVMYNAGTFIAIENSFNGNVADSFGGAVYNYGFFTATGNAFNGNTAQYGGAVYNTGTFSATGNTFSGNTAGYDGGAMNGNGTFINNTFSENTANYGGAVSGSGTFTSNTFSRNKASDGGAVIGSGTFTSNVFNGNSAVNGGAVYNGYGVSTATSNVFSGNTAFNDFFGGGGYGGAAYNDDTGTFTIIRSIFRENTASFGGAVCNNYGVSTVTGNTFSGNKASSGGAVYNTYILAMTGNTFCKNTASVGGAVYNSMESIFTATSNTFSENSSEKNGGALYCPGTLINNIFSGNIAGTDGGAVYNPEKNIFVASGNTFNGNTAGENGGVAYNSTNSVFTAINNIFSGNIAKTDGGVGYNDFGTFAATDNLFSGNTAGGSGGVVWNESGTFIAIGNTFSKNTAFCNGGVVNSYFGTVTATDNTFRENISEWSGGVVWNESSTFTAVGNTFSGNMALCNGGAVNNHSGSFIATSNTFYNNFGTDGGAIHNSDDFSATNNVFSGNTAGGSGGVVWNDECGVFTATGNIFEGNTALINGGAVNNHLGAFTATSNTFRGNTAAKGGAIYQFGSASVLILQDSSFLTKTDTIYIEGGSVTFGGNISLAGNLYSTSAITVESGTKIIYDLSSYDVANTTEIITNLDAILNPTSEVTYQVKVGGNQAYGRYLLATGSTARTISVISDMGTLVQSMSVGDIIFNPQDSGMIFRYTLDSEGKLYFEVAENKKPTITVTVSPTVWTNTSVTVTAVFIDEFGCGLKSTKYSVDGQTWTNYTSALVLDENQTVCFKAEDNVGNVTTQDVTVCNIDRIKPTINVNQGMDVWTNEDVIVTAIFADDGGSQLKDTQYSFDMETWINYTSALFIDANKTIYFKATDNAANETMESITIGNIDKIPPTITVNGDSGAWTKDPVTLTVTFADEGGSGLKSQMYSFDGETWITYEEPLAIEKNGDVFFKADDNAGNVFTRKVTIDRIENEGPVITVTQNPEEWTEGTVTLTATFEDKQSGVAKREYKIGDGDWLEYADDTKLIFTENGYIFFRGSDNMGNISLKSYEIHSITASEPTPSIIIPAGDTQTIMKSLYDVKNFDIKKGTTVIAEGLQMQDGNAKLAVADGSSLSAAEILPGDGGSKTAVTLKNDVSLTVRNDMCGIENLTTGKNAVVYINGEYTGATEKSKASFGTCSTVTVAKGIFSVNKLTLGNGTAANSKKGTLEQHSVLEANEIEGTSFGDTLTFGNYAEVRITKDIVLDDGGSDAVKIGNYSKFNANDVKFSGDTKNKNTFSLGTAGTASVDNILNVNKVTLSNGVYDKKSCIISYTELTAATIIGSSFADTLSFGNYNDVDLIGDVDLSSSGSDTVKIGNYSEFNAKDIMFSDDIKSKNTFNLGTASTATVGNILNVNKVTLSNGVYDKKSGVTTYTGLTATTITGSTFGDSLSFGNYSNVDLSGDVDLSAGGSDMVKIGNYSNFNVSDINFSNAAKSKNTFNLGTASTATVGNILNVNKVTLSNGIAANAKKGTPQLLTHLTATEITGSTFGDTLSFGNDSKTEISGDITLGDGNDTLKIGNNAEFNVNTIDFGTGNDTLSIGKSSIVNLASINFGNGDAKSKDTMMVGSLSTVTIGKITGVNKITVSNGTAANAKKGLDAAYTNLTTGNISGTDDNDTITLGNYTTIVTGNINLGDGAKDKLSVGSDSILEIRGSLRGLETASIGKNSMVAASNNAISTIKSACGAKGVGKNVTFVSLGDNTAASAFKGVEAENADNDFDSATSIQSMTGWLSDADATYCDDIDCYTLGELSIGDLKGKTVTGERINVSVWGKSGGEFKEIADAVTQSGDTWTFNDIAATYADYRIKVALADDGTEKAISYKINLA